MTKFPLGMMLVLAAGFAFGADTTASRKAKGYLPYGYRKLNLSQEQTEKIQAIHARHREKLKGLKKALAEEKKAERKELDSVLTEEQRKLLEENRNKYKAKVKTRVKKSDKAKPEAKKSEKE